jgi:hypothetical protein
MGDEPLTTELIRDHSVLFTDITFEAISLNGIPQIFHRPSLMYVYR